MSLPVGSWFGGGVGGALGPELMASASGAAHTSARRLGTARRRIMGTSLTDGRSESDSDASGWVWASTFDARSARVVPRHLGRGPARAIAFGYNRLCLKRLEPGPVYTAYSSGSQASPSSPGGPM